MNLSMQFGPDKSHQMPAIDMDEALDNPKIIPFPGKNRGKPQLIDPGSLTATQDAVDRPFVEHYGKGGYREPVLFSEHKGKKYVIDGHHRVSSDLGGSDHPGQIPGQMRLTIGQERH